MSEKINESGQRPKLRSLRNIMSKHQVIADQGRTPIISHIHRRDHESRDKNLSYFDKLKHMIKNSESLYKRSNNLQKTEGSVKKIEVSEVKKGTSQPKHFKIRNVQEPIFKEEKFDSHVQILDLNIQLRKKIYSNKNTVSDCYHPSKEDKKEIINYAKFTPILNYGEVFEKVEMKELLGTGATAKVRRCIYRGENYAVKIFQKYKLIQPRKKKRVYTEAQILGNLKRHPNIIELHQAYEDKRQIHMIFEHIDGAFTLHQFFKNNRLRLEEKTIKSIFARVLRGVIHLHEKGIAHRDLKPDNILLGFDEDGEMIVKIIDLGFATTNKIGDLQCGTPNFMAPQLTEKKTKYCPFKADCWALGVLLFYLFEGRYPFRGMDEKDLFRNIRIGYYELKRIQSQQVKELLDTILRTRPDDRPLTQQVLFCSWFKN